MITLEFNPKNNNDLMLDKEGNLSIVSDQKAVMQVCEAVAETLLGECEYNTSEGLPYRELIFIATPNVKLFMSLLIKRLLLIEGVVAATTQKATVQNGVFSYVLKIDTIYGSESIAGEVAQ